MQSHIGCICLTFLHCVLKSKSVQLFSTVLFKMCLQNVSPRRGKVTLVAFVWLFSTLIFQMCRQIVCTRNCIITLYVLRWNFVTISSMSALVRPAWAVMCIFKLCPLEDGLAHISHDESLPSANSDHVDLQTFPTWENFCTTYAFVTTFCRNKAFTHS